MNEYTAPLRDMRFVLNELVGLEQVSSLPGCEEVNIELVDQILDESARFCREVIAPLNKTGDMEEVSELTVVNTDTEETVVLIYNKVVDSPNQYAALDYYLVAKDISDGIKPFQFTVQRLHEFVLRPDVASRYKLLDVKAEEAVIQLPDGKKYTVFKYPKSGTLTQ